MDVRIVELPETRVAVAEHRGGNRLSHASIVAPEREDAIARVALEITVVLAVEEEAPA